MNKNIITIYLIGILGSHLSMAEEEKSWRVEAYEEFATTNKQLKSAYQKVRLALVREHTEEASVVKNFTAAHKAWLKWRDLEAEVKAYGESGGGHTHGAAIYLAQAEMNRMRIHTLLGEEQTKIIVPKRGTQLRKDICNAFRVPMKREVNGQKIVFVIHTLNVMGDYAFISCSLQLANGKQVNWKNSKYRKDIEDGVFDNNAAGLLRRNARGKWTVLESSLGSTDVAWIGWDEQYKLPKKLFQN